MKNEHEIVKGLHCQIYRSDLMGGCASGGISERVKNVTLIGDGVDGVFEPSVDAPAVKLVKRNIDGIYVHAEPDLTHATNATELARIGTETPWLMAGGTFIYSCDSRFGQAVGHSQPISLHDRFEKA